MRLAILLRNGPGAALLLLTTLSVLLSLGGCFLDEIDKAANWQQQGQEPAAQEAPEPQAAPAAAMQANWWASAKSLGSEESKTDIVTCKVGNSTHFMEREACLARGGKIP